MCRRVFNKTIILLGLAGYEMITTNSALRASLVNTISYPARPRRIIVKYIYIYIVYVIESAAYGVIFTSCSCENPNERGTSE